MINHNRFQDLSNQIFGYLKVVNLHHLNKGAYWNCLCKCGKEKVILASRLKNGQTKSCGCYNREQSSKLNYKGSTYITGREFTKIKQQAKIRNLSFDLTIKYIEQLYEKQNFKCSLSGIKIEFDSRTPHKNKKYGNASIDRINSSKGYTEDNIQIVDKNINIAKMSMSQQEFIDMCKRVSKYNE